MQGPDTDAQDQPPPFTHIRLATHGRSIQMGQTLPKCVVRATSGFRPIATEMRTSRDVSNVSTKAQKPVQLWSIPEADTKRAGQFVSSRIAKPQKTQIIAAWN